MRISLSKLILKNFKGIKNLAMDFAKVTNIYGENGTGKSTVFDAFTWLLFDKDSQDRSKFDIQPLDEENNVIHMLETEVQGVLNIDGREISLTKVLKEKWVKKRGEVESELKGTETSYYIDEVPAKMGEYKARINEIINENIFKLITNPLYFSTNMKWQDRRGIILKIVGDITNDKIIASNEKLQGLANLLDNSSIDELKKSTSAKKKKLMDDKQSIPYRVDELNNSIREYDFDALEFQKKNILGSIFAVEEKLIDSNKVNEEMLKKQNKLYKLKTRLNEIEYTAKREAEKPKEILKESLYKQKANLSASNNDLTLITRELESNNLIVSRLEKDMAALREKFDEVQTTPFEIDESKFICPTCKRPLEVENIDVLTKELTENHNQNISKQLASINAEGKRKKEELEKIKIKIESNTSAAENIMNCIKEVTVLCEDLENKIAEFVPVVDLDSNNQYQITLKDIQEVEAKLNQPVEVDQDTQELKNKKIELQADLDQINKNLAAKDINQSTKNRISELLDHEKALAQQIADLEKTEYLCEEFIKAKVNLLESSINEKFKYVKFKLFDVQVNGGINECCEALIDGVPFSNANTASQYNAGLDIINALSEHYSVYAPIFIDNRESVNELIETNSQIINLIVSNDKSLKIENHESEVA
ncbi:AAA family ATPase [Clostridium sp. YIM B02551]|uniref:AAA family ATPase n=1 Tax=Clostridium sp. YIM B02551 TaxID=2910679 RepID=UPI001EEA79BE|nr:DUF2813 domain-containing protein [Clostridium sp. YIM B02551]